MYFIINTHGTWKRWQETELLSESSFLKPSHGAKILLFLVSLSPSVPSCVRFLRFSLSFLLLPLFSFFIISSFFFVAGRILAARQNFPSVTAADFSETVEIPLL